MPVAENYKPVRTILFPAEFITTLHDEPVSENSLFQDAVLPELAIGMIRTLTARSAPFVDSDYQQLRRVTPVHRRSLEITIHGDERMIWADEFGNIYTTRTTKGNNFTSPHVAKHDNSPSNFIVYGLQDSDALYRVQKASRMLREKGIPTELVTSLMKPVKVPFKNRLISQDELKATLLRQAIARQDNNPDLEDKNAIRSSDIPKITSFLKNTIFVVTERAMQVSERITDLAQARTKKEFIHMIENAMLYVNFTERLKAEADGVEPKFQFDPSNEQDITNFLIHYLPQLIAKSYATLHNLGLSHRFSAPHNVSTVGSIYDLDSVHGEALGDTPITSEDITNDLQQLVGGMRDIISFLMQKRYIRIPKRIDGFKSIKEIQEQANEDKTTIASSLYFQIFAQEFINTYLKHVGNNFDIVECAEILHPLLASVSQDGESDLVGIYATIAKRQLGIEYSFDQNATEVVDAYADSIAIDTYEQILTNFPQLSYLTPQQVLDISKLYGKSFRDDDFMFFVLDRILADLLNKISFEEFEKKYGDKIEKVQRWIAYQAFVSLHHQITSLNEDGELTNRIQVRIANIIGSVFLT